MQLHDEIQMPQTIPDSSSQSYSTMAFMDFLPNENDSYDLEMATIAPIVKITMVTTMEIEIT